MSSALQRLGLTRSTKVICQPTEKGRESFAELTADYSKSDHFDAYAVCQFLIGRELRRHGRTSKSVDDYHDLANLHRDKLSDEEIAK